MAEMQTSLTFGISYSIDIPSNIWSKFRLESDGKQGVNTGNLNNCCQHLASGVRQKPRDIDISKKTSSEIKFVASLLHIFIFYLCIKRGIIYYSQNDYIKGNLKSAHYGVWDFTVPHAKILRVKETWSF
jgi:hypothetical protein